MKIRLNTKLAGHAAGDTIDTTDSGARKLIELGAAVKAEETKPEPKRRSSKKATEDATD